MSANDKSIDDIKLRPIKYAILGYGGLAEFHQRRFNNLGLFELKGVCDIDFLRAEHAAWQGVIVYNSVQEIANDPEIELVLINCPGSGDGNAIIQLAKAKKHLFCEKHAAVNPKNWDAMVEVARQEDVLLVLNHNRRLDKDFRIVQDLVCKNTLGRVYKIVSNVSGGNGVFKEWMKYKSSYGGAMLNWGIHLIDQICLLDKSALQIKHCNLSYVLGHETEDGFELDLSFDSGLQAKIVVDNNSFIPQPRWQVWATRGSAIIHDWDCNGYIVFSKGVGSAISGVHLGNGYSKSKSQLNPNSIMQRKLPNVKLDQDMYYKNLAYSIRNGYNFDDNQSIKRVLSIALGALDVGKV
ncbi:MAG: Gfo/Idh/MocA family oxidoreductase [Firmicutes bacterium]|nr:Gfo/Idh/MocA family oxidoreductase [Bacillota bacterium]MCL1953766.1 Gfo/Idh/MocA family oxidoreductase [Bacillota bacterium]